MNDSEASHNDVVPFLEPQVQHTTNLTHTRHGQETCPLYSCTITLSCNLFMKHELDAPDIPSSNRRWFLAHIEVIGTMLNISTFPSKRLLRSPHSPPSTSHSKRLTQSYTLQGAEVGIANDYKKRNFVIRVRAEAEQFLLEVESLSVLLNVIHVLETAIDISLPLENRKMPGSSRYPRRTPVAIPLKDQPTRTMLFKRWIRRVVRPSYFPSTGVGREVITTSLSNVRDTNRSIRSWSFRS